MVCACWLTFVELVAVHVLELLEGVERGTTVANLRAGRVGEHMVPTLSAAIQCTWKTARLGPKARQHLAA